MTDPGTLVVVERIGLEADARQSFYYVITLAIVGGVASRRSWLGYAMRHVALGSPPFCAPSCLAGRRPRKGRDRWDVATFAGADHDPDLAPALACRTRCGRG